MRGRRVRRVTACAAAALATAASAPAALADRTQESLFQDDDHLVYASSAVVDRTLSVLRSLGVDRIRVTVLWSAIAPSPTSRTRPAGFDARDPAAYPNGVWDPYDRIVALAGLHDIGVQFNVTAPGPLWAMRRDSPTARAADHWAPSAHEFGQFMAALGTRYGGRFGKVPRVGDWSIWNEPDQPGWLAPQWQTRGRAVVPVSSRLYRAELAAAWSALRLTGHARDTILIGELAPAGFASPGFYSATAPIPFLDALYCVDQRDRRLRGHVAALLGCPRTGTRRSFVSANPGLFEASGVGHHPYDFFHPPSAGSPNPDFAPLANLHRLERTLDGALAAYAVHRRLPLFLTEYGYQTRPPDPFQVFTPRQQAAFLNEADYIASRDPRVRSVAQFLLDDSGPDTRFPPADFSYWDTFQTGLRYADGRPKPAFAAYRMPIWIPVRTARRGRAMLVWGQLRPAPRHTTQRAQIQWRRPSGQYRTIATVTTHNPQAYLTARVRPPGSGRLRIVWTSPVGRVLISRGVSVRVS